MFRYSWPSLFLKKVFQVTKPPTGGYELVELPSEKILNEFMQHFKKKAILVVVHSGDIYPDEAYADSSKLGGPKGKSAPKSVMPDSENSQKASPYSALRDPLTRTFISSLNAVNLGNPDELRIALVPGPKAPYLVNRYSILTYPTTLLFVEGGNSPHLHYFSMVVSGAFEKPRWDGSTKDDAHPFPERPHMYTNTRYNGVEVVSTHFPETIKGAAQLRLPEALKPQVLETNRTKVRSLNRYTFQCPALQDAEPPMSYLATLIVDDHSREKKTKEQRWCASTALEGNHANRFVRPKSEPDYVRWNKRKTILNAFTYMSPMRRTEEAVKQMHHAKQQQLRATEPTPLVSYKHADCPDVFKMSNADEWWKLDPVKVAKEQAALKDTLLRN